MKATSTITGIIDGSGAIGAAFLQPMIPYMGDHVFTAYTGKLYNKNLGN